MSDPAIKISVRNGTVIIRFPARLLRARTASPSRGASTNRQALKAVRGMWKRRRLDPLAYQREARNEWN